MDGHGLSSGQQRLFSMMMVEPDNPSFNETLAYEFDKVLDLAALETAFKRVLARHEVLRTRYLFDTSKGTASSFADPENKVSLEFSVETFDDASATVKMTMFASRPFNLSKDLPIRCLILKNETKMLLLIVIHRIAYDGSSESVLMTELQEIYNSIVSGNENPDLPELKFQYHEYAKVERKESTELKDRMEYWRKHLGGMAKLQLITDFSRKNPGFNGASERFTLDANLVKQLNELSVGESCTMDVVMLSLFKILLYRLTGEEDVAIATSNTKRRSEFAEFDAVLGFFTETMVLRTQLSTTDPISKLLALVKQTVSDSFENTVTFDHLVNEFGDQNDGSPLSDVLFTYRNDERPTVVLNQAEPRRLHVKPSGAEVPLVLIIEPKDDGSIEGELTFNTALFSKVTARRIVTQYTQLAKSVVTMHDDVPISKLSMLDADGLYLVSNVYPLSETTAPSNKPLHAAFEASVKRAPDATALVTSTETLTYSELNARANRLAHYLRKNHGVIADSRVALCMDKNASMIVSMLAALKSGGAYVPMSPEYPITRIATILEDAAPNVLIVEAGATDWAGDDELNGVPIITVTEQGFFEGSGDEPDTNPEWISGGESACYLIYTSGSTGKPKGVVLNHYNLACFIPAILKVHPVDNSCRSMFVASYTFDAHVMQVYVTFAAGGSLYTFHKLEMLENLNELLQKHKITMMLGATPTFLSAVDFKGATALRVLSTGGEAVPHDLIVRSTTQRPEAVVVNVYGPTEVSVVSSALKVSHDMEYPTSIGPPLPNLHGYIVDPTDLSLVPPGVPGELVVSGEQVGRGYRNLPDKTAAVFIASPFAEPGSPHARMYRTGDLCRWLPDGTIGFMGRIDHQVKLRGFRIELGEIENVLLQYENVATCAVQVCAGASGSENDKFLCAYVGLEEEMKDDDRSNIKADLKALANSKLAKYMVPSAFVVLDDMPLLPSGKINRKVLPAPSEEDKMMKAAGAFVAPQTDLEKRLAGMFKDVLKLDRSVGLDDDFFDLGGNSLKAATLISLLRMELGSELSLKGFYAISPTIGNLAKIVTPDDDDDEPEAPEPGRVSNCIFFLSSLFQFIGAWSLFWFEIILFVLANIALLPVFDQVEAGAIPLSYLYAALPVIPLVLHALFLFLTVILKRIVMWRLTPGRYPVHSIYYTRWWFSESLIGLAVPFAAPLQGTIFLNWWWQLLGAKIGSGTRIYSTQLRGCDQIEIGDATLVGSGCTIASCYVHNGFLVIEPISVGKECSLGPNTAINAGAILQDKVDLAPLAVVETQLLLNSDSSWIGSPLQKWDRPRSNGTVPFNCTDYFVHFLGISFYFLLLGYSMAVQLYVILELEDAQIYWQPLVGTQTKFIMTIVIFFYPLYLMSSFIYLIVTIILKWVILGKRKVGTFSLDSLQARRVWLNDLILGAGGNVGILSFFDYAPSLRIQPLVAWLLGGQLAPGVQFPSVNLKSLDMMRMHHHTHIGGGVQIMSSVFFGSMMTSDYITLEEGSFVGAMSVVLAGAHIGKKAMVGALSVVNECDVEPFTINIGSPLTTLSKTQDDESAPEKVGCCSKMCDIFGQLFTVAARFVFPTVLWYIFFALLGWVLLLSPLDLFDPNKGRIVPVLFSLLVALAPILILCLGIIIYKYVVVCGKFKPGVYPLKGLRYHQLNALKGAIAFWDSWIGVRFKGTSLMPVFYRCMGAKIGSNVVLENETVYDFELLDIGDYVSLGRGVGLMAHADDTSGIEFGKITMGKGSSIQMNTVVLPNSVISNNTFIGSLSLVMKGESFPPNTHWEGSPAVKVPRSKRANRVADVELLLQMATDAKYLDPEIQIPRKYQFSGKYESVFLTGVTGFFGAFLLDAFLNNKDVKRIYCLVRAKGEAEGMARIVKALNGYDLSTKGLERVHVIVGDLGKPRLGMTEEQFMQVGLDVDILVHNGAIVSFLQSYQNMFDANVEGTTEILKLSVVKGRKYPAHIHYVSTMSVLEATKPKKGPVKYPESISAQLGPDLAIGYSQTKWVAEKRMLLAIKRGFPVSIYRLGRVAGDSRTGAANKSDITTLFLKGCVEMQRLPLPMDVEVDLFPANLLARAMLAIFTQKKCIGKVFHMQNPHSIKLTQFYGALRDAGYRLSARSYERWLIQVRRDEDNSFLPLVDTLIFWNEHGNFNVGTEFSKQVCEQANVEFCPPVTKELLSLYVKWFKECQFFPEPDELTWDTDLSSAKPSASSKRLPFRHTASAKLRSGGYSSVPTFDITE